MASEFRFLEDIALADVAFEVTADSVSELFTAAAQAVIETMVDPRTLRASWTRTVRHDDPELGALLFEWLSDIVYWKDADGVIPRDVSVEVRHAEAPHTSRMEGGPADAPILTWQLRGSVRGEAIDPSRQDLRSDIKAVTKHLYTVEPRGTRWFARVVLDI